MNNRTDSSTASSGNATTASTRAACETMGDGLPDTNVITLSNASGMEVEVMSFGGIIRRIITPDRNGTVADIVLGYPNARDYRNDRSYFGALIGRNANRIADAEFTLNGIRYQLAKNDGENHLHGGVSGFNSREWKVLTFENANESGVILSLVSAAGDEGYPGTLSVEVRYEINSANELRVSYRAETDAPTPVNFTQHTYFNLSGVARSDILDHELMINAHAFLPVDRFLIPTGEIRRVEGTPFDFTTSKVIGDCISANDEQLRLGGGFDHNFVVNESQIGGPRPIARLKHTPSGRSVEIHSTEPGIQLFTGNQTATIANGKGGAYVRHAGVALETQHFPDAPNHATFPSTILQPGQTYSSETVYRFLTDASD